MLLPIRPKVSATSYSATYNFGLDKWRESDIFRHR